MSALFAKILKQTLVTFDLQNAGAFRANFNVLKQLVDQVTYKDLNIDPYLMTEEAFQHPDKAPCTYIHVFENERVAMSVFIIQGGYTMPLHDHPMMHGILKGISGNLAVSSYTKVPDDGPIYVKAAKQIHVKSQPTKYVMNHSECAVLTPTDRNFHEIGAVGGVAAFFDILSPPYDSNIPIHGRRLCSFYRKHFESSNRLILERIPTPPSYYCDTGEYHPPHFIYEHL